MDATYCDSGDDDTLSVNTLDLERQSREEWEAEIARLVALSGKVRYLHASLLFYSAESKVGELCDETCKTIIKKVGSTHHDWSKLGYHLGISQIDLDYIEHSVKNDYTETVLRVYMQHEAATLDKVTEAFIKMERYDILKAVEEPFQELNRYFFKGNTSTSVSSGYGSECNDSELRIFKPKNIPNNLPNVLRERPKKPLDASKPTKPADKIQNGSPKVLLSFAEDGIEFAETIRNAITSWSAESIVVETLTLDNRKNEVLQNPQSFIRDYIEQANYIIPIVTEGYLEVIESTGQAIPSFTDNLDAKYARYIFTQLMHNYVFVDGCLNKKVRCVLPENVDRNIVLKLPPYSVLMPWTCEVDFDEVFKDLLSKVSRCD